MEVPDDALYGIHAMRARNNFPDTTPFHREWYRAIGTVKQACYLTARDYFRAMEEKYGKEKGEGGREKKLIMDNGQLIIENGKLKTENDFVIQSFSQSVNQSIPVTRHASRVTGSDTPLALDQKLSLLIGAAGEVAGGLHFDHFIVPAVSGGAGTSINMNVNEIIANVALLGAGAEPGQYHLVDPVEDANIFQSTNDVIPTSLKVAAIQLLNDLEQHINGLRSVLEHQERRHQNDLRIGYTQMQEAVPSSFGKLFSTYSDALSRDWWRVSKCFERIKTVNLGGGAIGTGLAVPRYFIMEAISHLQKLTALPVTRSENLADATSNLDSFVEVHATLKAHAVNLEKMVSDLRLLASDLVNGQWTIDNGQLTIENEKLKIESGKLKTENGSDTPFEPYTRHASPVTRHASFVSRQLELPQVQVGSSIMPGKINPVIPEFVISAAHKVYANDQLISGLCAQGCLELNAYLPVIGHALLESLKLLIACDRTLKENLLQGLQVNPEAGLDRLFHSPAITTALIPLIGYNKASELAKFMKESGQDIRSANRNLNMVPEDQLERLLKSENLLKLGYTLSELD
jgi:aspartate ammonia-lyase